MLIELAEPTGLFGPGAEIGVALVGDAPVGVAGGGCGVGGGGGQSTAASQSSVTHTSASHSAPSKSDNMNTISRRSAYVRERRGIPACTWV